jgi:hypothetical protein
MRMSIDSQPTGPARLRIVNAVLLARSLWQFIDYKNYGCFAILNESYF